MAWAGRTFGFGRPTVISVLLAALVLGACSGAPSDEPGPSDASPGYLDEPFRARAGVLLARPRAQEEQNTTFVELVSLIRHTPPGETIRIVAHSFSFVPVAEALAAAHERGVHVQVLTDASVSGDWQAPDRLRRALGTDPRADSFVLLARGELHQKTWSFTRTGDSRDVVLMGSMNLTYQSARQYTDTYAYVGRRDVRRVLDRRFDRLVRDLPDVAPQPHADLADDRVWFYPGYDESTDPVRQALGAVPSAGATIRVVMYAWLDERGVGLAELLAAKQAEGADVEVVLGRSVGPRPRQILSDAGVSMHEGVFADGDDIHHKLTLVSYVGTDGVRHRFVLTGSDNFTSKSLRRPEMLLQIDADDGTTWTRYQRFVDRIVARSRREATVG